MIILIQSSNLKPHKFCDKSLVIWPIYIKSDFFFIIEIMYVSF